MSDRTASTKLLHHGDFVRFRAADAVSAGTYVTTLA